jgi:hypothetical protein
MAEDKVKEFVDSLEQSDNIKAGEDIKAALANKVSAALDDRKVDVAQSMFPGETTSEVPSDENAE